MRALPLLLALLLVGCDVFGGSSVEIVRYTGQPITEASATVPNAPFPPARWLGIRSADVIHLSRATTCGDECSRTLALRFEGTGALPSDVAGTATVREFLPERTAIEPLDIRRVEIQDWGPEIFSGLVHLESDDDVLDLDAPLVFWVERPLPPAD